MEWVLRSNNYGGIVFLRLQNNGIKRAYLMQDAGNQIIDGIPMNYYLKERMQIRKAFSIQFLKLLTIIRSHFY